MKKKTTKPKAASRQRRPTTEGEWISGLTRLAAVISGEFKITCSKQNIVSWRKWQPPFPAATDGNRYHLPACLAWMRENYLAGSGELTLESKRLFALALKAENQTTIDKQQKGEILLGVLKKKYIERAIAERTFAGAMKLIKARFGQELKHNTTAARVKLESLRTATGEGIAAELIARYLEFDLAMSKEMRGRIEAFFEEQATSVVPPGETPKSKK